MMVSAWWLVAAFIAGGYAGILVLALMRFASEEPERAALIASASGSRWSDLPGHHHKHSVL